MKNQRIKILVMALCLTLALTSCTSKSSSGNQTSGDNAPTAAVALKPLPVAKKINPLTGLALAEGVADGQRPIAIMVGNHQPSLPQRGLAAADLLYEMPIEGQSTRLMAMYGNSNAIPQTGPVRGLSDSFAQLAIPSNGVLVHIGSTVYANNLLNVLGYQDINGLYLGGSSFYFDQARTLPRSAGKLNENSWFTDTALVQASIAATAINPVAEVHTVFNFSDKTAPPSAPAQWVNLVYSDKANAGFIFNPETGLYGKYIFGAAHTDEDGTPLTYTNLILLLCQITPKPDGALPEIDLREGTGVYITAGGVQNISWQKGSPTEPLRLLDENGEEIAVHTGKSYVGFLPQDRDGAYSYGPFAEDGTPNYEAATTSKGTPLDIPPVTSEPVESAPPTQSVAPVPGSFPPPAETPPQELAEAPPPVPPTSEDPAAVPPA